VLHDPLARKMCGRSELSPRATKRKNRGGWWWLTGGGERLAEGGRLDKRSRKGSFIAAMREGQVG
jgi:hypothetical protein